MKIIADAHIPFVKEYFADQGELILKPGREMTQKDTKDADILLVRSITPVNEKLLASSRVKFVGSLTAGADHLDLPWLTSAGIEVAIAAGFNAPPVADYVISVLAVLRRAQLIPEKDFKVGIVGVGNVGRLVLERFKLFPCEIILCDPPRAMSEADFTSVSLAEFRDLDFITLHVPLIKEGDHPTYHLIDAAFLKRQQPGCILLNASRGAVIDTSALLQHGNHLTWCLDVWENEPNINQTMLAKAFIATPHIAGYSKQSKIRGIEMIYQSACKAGIIRPLTPPPITMPTQTLRFADQFAEWEDVVLGVFNPTALTSMMRTALLNAKHAGTLFDAMRNQFNYRHEFSYTCVDGGHINHDDQQLLTKMGIMFNNLSSIST